MITSIKVELAGIVQNILPGQLEYYKAMGWKVPGADQESPASKEQGALPKKKTPKGKANENT